MLVVLSVALMVVDARFAALGQARAAMGLVLMEFYWITDMPVRAWNNLSAQFTSHSELLAENEKLKAEALLMERRLQRLAALTEQNVRLRELLNSAALVDDEVLAEAGVTDLSGYAVDPAQPLLPDLFLD